MTSATVSPLSPVEARQQLADEWTARNPQTPAEILNFYRTAEHLAPDLLAFHADPARQSWTSALAQTAEQLLTNSKTKNYIDIGSGLGHDLRAVRAVVPDATIHGVEPNRWLARSCDYGNSWGGIFPIYQDVADAPIETADLLSCFDVLEHVPNPEEWLGNIARRCKVGAVLLETCATFDLGTPLHLIENAGWHPGRVLEENGFELVGGTNRVRFWNKRPAKVTHTGLMLCAYRGVSTDTFLSILKLLDVQKDKYGWRISTTGEAGINRSRSVLTSRWYREMADDVFLMIDDDIIFQPQDAQRIVDLCRDGHDVICAAYPVRDGAHVAVRGKDVQTTNWAFGPGAEPLEVRWGSTGFIAIHRRVIEAMVKTLPLCHGGTAFSFWPLFDFRVVEDPQAGGFNYLSEDWNFCERAIELGFKVWMDPAIILGHLAQVTLHVGNMKTIHEAITVR